MTNQERLEEYLVGTSGYLKSDISNGKVIMLSGKWGSGKTHFWKNIIEKNLKSEKIPNNYISLYGKTSIEEIKNEVFLKIFEGMDIFKIDDKSVNLAKNTANLIADFTKTVSVFGINLDLSKIVDKSFEKLDEVRGKQQEEKTKALLNSGAIICFDDFERKSKDIDLNDLFGFITQLTLNFNCKVVIILNDDVFEGEEKKIFSNVKEKSVAKFLKYEPSIQELFETIFSDDRYRILDEHKAIILKTIEETEELNARIYIQVLDNLVEWIEKINITNDNFIKYLIFVNINFILNHLVLYAYINSNKKGIAILKETSSFQQEKEINLFLNCKIENIPSQIDSILNSIINIEDLINKINIKKDRESLPPSSTVTDSRQYLYDFIKKNTNLLKSILFFRKIDLKKLIESNNKAESEIFNKISNFIESGILINE